MAPRQTEWDFGLSRLTKFFAGPWSYDRTVDQTITDAALGHLGEPAGEAARAILADAVRLEQSSLSTEVIATVWAVASEGGYNLAYFGVDGRDWLRHVAAVCSEQARQADPAGTLVIEAVAASEDSVRAVVAAIAAAEPSLAAKAETFFGHEPGRWSGPWSWSPRRSIPTSASGSSSGCWAPAGCRSRMPSTPSTRLSVRCSATGASTCPMWSM